ncbi:hypothetical protein Q9L58_007067 [Maublancomyces gigas]|uniref:Uncharacterized protein n=1 Tax=Discina gigas TaxID=1032678 RepID=A0ABR3GDS4_9PEZI
MLALASDLLFVVLFVVGFICVVRAREPQTDNEDHAYLRVQRVKGEVQYRRRPKFYGMLKAPRNADSSLRAAATELSEFDKCLQRARAVDDANNRASASLLPRQFPISRVAWDTTPLALDCLPLSGLEESMVETMDWTPEVVSLPVSAPLINFVDTTPDMDWEASPAEVAVVAATAAVLNQQPVIVTGLVQNMQSFNFTANTTVASAPAIVAGPVNAAIAPAATTITAAVAAPPRAVAACRKPRQKSVATAVPVAVAPIVKAVVDTTAAAPTGIPTGIPTYFSAPVAPVAPVAPMAPMASVAPVAPVAPMAPVAAPEAPVAAPSAPVAAPEAPVAAPSAVPTSRKKPMSSTPVVDAAEEEQGASDEEESASDEEDSASDEEASDEEESFYDEDSASDEEESSASDKEESSDSGEGSSAGSYSSEDPFDGFLNRVGIESSDDEDEEHSAGIEWTDEEDEDEDDDDQSSSSGSDVAAGPSVVSSGPAVAGSVEIPGLFTSSVLPSGPAAPRKIKAMPVRRK